MDHPAGSVLDASALLAYLQGEPGGETVQAALAVGAIINVVNYAVVTADRIWAAVGVGVTVRLIRP